MQIRLGQRLIHTSLVGAEGTAALQDQRDALEGRPLGCDVRLPMRGPGSGHGERRLWTRPAKTTVMRQVG